MKKLNIVYILADDLGYGDLKCYNNSSKIPTSNIDQIAKEGMRFTDAHSPSSVCTPSRYGILTGRYCWRTRLKKGVFQGYNLPLIKISRLTLAGLLKKVGYDTACIGKWHLGLKYKAKPKYNFDFTNPPGFDKEFEEKNDFSQPVEGGPTDLGFDRFFGTAACSTCNAPYGFIKNKEFIKIPSFYHNNPVYTSRPGLMVPGWEHKKADTTFCKQAVKYIKERQNKTRPFFLYLATSAPHEPCTEDVVPEFARGKSEAGPRGDLVWLVDWIVGEIVKTLKNTGQYDNTMFVITSDNGALPGDRILGEDGEDHYFTYGHKSCGNWRGYKAHIWEGGHREPFIIRFPGIVKPNSVSNALVGLHDFYATCAELFNFELTNDIAEDSFSFLYVLTGKKPQQPVRNHIVHHSQKGVFSIRKGEWKLILETLGSGGWPPPKGEGPKPGSPGQLYNIKRDPYEKNNLFNKYPNIVKELTQFLEKLKERGESTPLRGNNN